MQKKRGLNHDDENPFLLGKAAENLSLKTRPHPRISVSVYGVKKIQKLTLSQGLQKKTLNKNIRPPG